MDNRKSTTFNLHCFKAFEHISNKLIKTFTVDRGKEFANYNEIENRLNIDVYFADPYSSWQRGTNENINGLLREYFPKKQDLTEIKPSLIRDKTLILNQRPRKCLNWKSPFEVYFDISLHLT